MVEDIELTRKKDVIAVIDFHQTPSYPTDASPRQLPDLMLPPTRMVASTRSTILRGTPPKAPTKQTTLGTGAR
jgi:hypothetical protein